MILLRREPALDGYWLRCQECNRPNWVWVTTVLPRMSIGKRRSYAAPSAEAPIVLSASPWPLQGVWGLKLLQIFCFAISRMPLRPQWKPSVEQLRAEHVPQSILRRSMPSETTAEESW